MFEWMKDNGRNTENVPCRAVIYHHLIIFKLQGSWMAEISNLKSGRSNLNCFQLDWTNQQVTNFFNNGCRLDALMAAVLSDIDSNLRERQKLKSSSLFLTGFGKSLVEYCGTSRLTEASPFPNVFFGLFSKRTYDINLSVLVNGLFWFMIK